LTQTYGLLPSSAIARLTGLILLGVTLTHMAGYQISSQFAVPGDFAATTANVVQGEPLYRMALFSYLTSSLLSVGLAIGLYLILAPINRFAALLVLGWRLAEALIASVAWAVRFAILDNQTQTGLMGAQGQEAIHIALRAVSSAAFDISAVCLAIATLIGFSVMLRARLIPMILSLVALLGAFCVLAGSVSTLLDLADNIPSHLAFAITLLSQLAIGVWLAVRGVNYQKAGLKATA
jgi:Domain of unknown function (DUF4386)